MQPPFTAPGRCCEHRRRATHPFLPFLAAVFTIGVTFAAIELPYLVDDLLQRTGTPPALDTHADAATELKPALFAARYHLRTIGYVCFALLVGLVVIGFATRKSGSTTRRHCR